VKEPLPVVTSISIGEEVANLKEKTLKPDNGCVSYFGGRK
jgi:hypothetical protein